MDEWTRGKRQPPPLGGNREGRWTRGHGGRGQSMVGGARARWAGPGQGEWGRVTVGGSRVTVGGARVSLAWCTVDQTRAQLPSLHSSPGAATRTRSQGCVCITQQ